MTEPDAIERVPTKVVPYYVVGYDEETIPAGPETEPVELSRIPTALVGIVALGFAVITAVVQVIAIVTASAHDFEQGTVLAWSAIVLSVFAVAGGVVAIILRRGRRWGVVAIVLGVIGNPFILLVVLSFVRGLEAG